MLAAVFVNVLIISETHDQRAIHIQQYIHSSAAVRLRSPGAPSFFSFFFSYGHSKQCIGLYSLLVYLKTNEQ